LLLTATPHSGDRRAFQRLLVLGGTSEPMLWFRRERTDVGFSVARRSRWWRVRPSNTDARMLEALRAYARHVDRQGDAAARLAMIVLRKRALSSAFALGRSLIKRRRLLRAEPEDQMLLPFGFDPGEVDNGDGDEADLLGAPGLPDRSSELAALDRLVDLSREAEAEWAKWKRIARLVRRTSEPILLFTEYRDTLEAIARKLEGHASFVVLHGGLPRDARTDAIAQFTRGHVRVLVATDVAAEGLNLHARCRLVVNVELPWSPTRLEQRAGRVDRLGQSRAVRVWTLAGASGHEAMVVAALARRAEAIRSDLDQREPVTEAPAPSPCELDAEARRAWQTAMDLRRTRNARPVRTDAVGRRRRREGPIWIRLRRSGAHGPPAIIIVFTRHPARLGDALAHVAVRVELTERLPGTPREWLPLVTAMALPCAQGAFAASTALIGCLANRERLLQGEAVRRAGVRPWQPSFFDRRADRVVHAVRDEMIRQTELHDARLRELTSNRHDEAPPDPVFALVLD
jgi:hypothetical protein